MNNIKSILDSSKKPKDKVKALTDYVLKSGVKELFEEFNKGNDVIKGTLAEVMKHVSASKPELFGPYIEILIANINHKANRVKWGVPETIGNIASRFPTKTLKAVPNLMINTKDKSTVVRWCAAYALTKIAEVDKSIISKFKTILKTEKNNGVKNLYLKHLNE